MTVVVVVLSCGRACGFQNWPRFVRVAGQNLEEWLCTMDASMSMEVADNLLLLTRLHQELLSTRSQCY